MFLIDCFVQSHHENQIEDLIKKLEQKKREGFHENDLNSKTDGATVDKYDDYETRVGNDDDGQLTRKGRTRETIEEKYFNIRH